MSRVGQAPWVWLVLLIAGVGQATALAWPGTYVETGLARGQALGWLQLMCMAVAVAVITRSANRRKATFNTWLFATAWLSTSFAWLYVSMHDYGGLPSWAAAAAVLLLASALALYYAAAGAVYWRWRDQNPVLAAVLFAAAWTLAELARGQWLTGFPWGAIGYAHVESGDQWFRWLGVYGVGAVAALISAAWVLSLLQRRYVSLVITTALAVLMSHWAPNLDRTQATGQLHVWLLQGNIEQDQKFNANTGIQQALQWYPSEWRASLQSLNRPDLVVAPETAIPVLPQQIDEQWWQRVLEPLAKQGVASDGKRVHWMMGMPLGDATRGYTNSAWGITTNSAQGEKPWMGDGDYRYDKHHLVPMGEFIPPFFRWFTEWMKIPLGSFNRGELVQAPWQINGQTVAAHICFEDVFGEEMAQTVASTQATVLVNLSNLAWFGKTIALEQHLNIARVRAMELGRPIVRATNTGATAHIDYQGQVLASLPMQVRERLEVWVQGRSGLTPYVQWVGAVGLWPLWGLGCLVVAWSVWRRKKWGSLGS
ncbi:MAG: apolipoprotein N-acyltransferase [Pseudomonadota bacterium]